MTFDKEYFEGKESNCIAYKDKSLIKKVYFPLAIVRENIQPQAKVLDVGCAFGYFLNCCDEYGLKTYGVDISEYAINEARKATNAELFVHDINDGLPMFEDNFFDIITAFDVIEHLTSPYNVLKEIKRILNKNGKLILTTPNINAVGRIFSGSNWHGFKDKTHLYLFPPISLEHLFSQAGLVVTSLITPFHPLPNIIQKLANRTGLGGQIWIVAKKKN